MAKASVAEPPVAAAARSRRTALLGLAWRWRYVGGFVASCGLVAGGYWYLTTPPPLPDSFVLRRALKDLDAGNVQQARNSVGRLEEKGYLDPDFPGGVEFIRGWAAFQEARAEDEVSRESAYLAAVQFLKEADRLSVPLAHRPQWAFALGLSLFHTGAVDESVPYLREAMEHYAAGRCESSMALVDAYAESHAPDLIRLAVSLSDEILKNPRLPAEQRDRAWLQRAQVLVHAGRKADAEAALKNVSRTFEADQGKVVLRALVAMADDENKALQILKPVADHDGVHRTFAAQALYLQGVCAERLARKAAEKSGDPEQSQKERRGWLENAVTYFERTCDRFERSQEALAARLGMADAFRELGRSEEALTAYGRVLRGIHQPEAFRNRWVSLRKVQERILAAWEGWIRERRFADAAALAELMPPVVPRAESDDLFARAHEHWVSDLEAEIAKLPANTRKQRQPELIERWKVCGQAWARSARSRAAGHADAFARSADFLMKGQEFRTAVEQLSQIIDTQPPHLITTALLKRGEACLHLDQTAEALADFQRLIKDFPTDQNAFQAQFRVGLCHLERNELDQAEAAWRKVLTSDTVAPESEEWRLSMFQLSRLVFQRADEELRKTEPIRTELGVRERRDDAYGRLDEAVRRLEEYLDRYPQTAEAMEVQTVLGRALRRSAERFEEKQQAAETENARAEFWKQRQSLLQRAVTRFESLQAELIERQRRGELEPVGKSLLRDACFELGHCRFALGEDQSAIDAYQVCVGRYQQDPESLTALVQMANCYKHLKQPSRVASTLAQAKLMLKQLPDEAFADRPGAMTRDDWTRWLDWALTLNQ